MGTGLKYRQCSAVCEGFVLLLTIRVSMKYVPLPFYVMEIAIILFPYHKPSDPSSPLNVGHKLGIMYLGGIFVAELILLRQLKGDQYDTDILTCRKIVIQCAIY